jgi:hypothetical protein
MHRRSLPAAILAFTLFGLVQPLQATFVRVTAEITTDVDIPVSSFFFLRTRLVNGQEMVYRSYSLNNPGIRGNGEVSIVETFVEDELSHYREYAFFAGAYGGTYENPEDVFTTIPPIRPLTPHTGLFTSLPFAPSVGDTFESIWGADEATIVDAYQTMVYDNPGISATPEELAEWNDAIRPFIDMVFRNPQNLLRWRGSPSGEYSVSGTVVQFSDPTVIGSIRGQFQSSLAAVPEPSTLTLAAFAGAGLLGYGWRRRTRIS